MSILFSSHVSFSPIFTSNTEAGSSVVLAVHNTSAMRIRYLAIDRSKEWWLVGPIDAGTQLTATDCTQSR